MDLFNPVETEERPQAARSVGSGVAWHDFGLHAYGRLSLDCAAGAPETIEVAFGEVLAADGRLDRAPGGSRIAFAATVALGPEGGRVSVPIPPWKGPGRRTPAQQDVDPPVTVFRYVEITGATRVVAPVRTRLTAPFDEAAAAFECSDATLKRVWDFCRHSIHATTAFGVYVDGNRERLPYEGDAYINQLGHFALDCDYSVARRTIDLLLEHPTWPTEWALIMVPVVYDYFMHSADLASLRRWHEPLQARLLPEHVDSATGLLTTAGDPFHRDIVDWPAGERDGTVMGDFNLVPNCYRVRALATQARLDDALGHAAAAQARRREAAALRAAVRTHFLKEGTFIDSIGADHLSLHGAVFALWGGVAEGAEIEALKRLIVARGMACSVYGAQFLLEVCFEHGLAEHAVALMTSDSPRSWVNMMRRGATITMEAWDDVFKPNQDWNHAWGAAPANLVARGLLGIRPTAPGFATYEVKPRLGGVARATYRYPTPRGAIVVEADGSGARHRLEF